jgi:hypothetical protein
MCPANGELENGDPESPVEFLCQVAHLRAYALGSHVPEHGDCPNCAPGAQHAALAESAQRIQRQAGDSGEWRERQASTPLLNVLQPASALGAACRSCSGH